MLKNTSNGMNAALYTVIEEICSDKLSASIIQLIDRKEQQENSFWKKFGYKYLAPLDKFSRQEVDEFFETLKLKNRYYACAILELYYGEQIPQNKTIVEELKAGSKEFKNEIGELWDKITLETAFYGIVYLSDFLTQYDEKNVYEAVRKVVIEDEIHYLPITPREKYAFGIVYPWPGTDTAETELLARTQKAAENINFDCYMLSDFGKILDDEQLETDEFVEGKNLDYVMTTHYESNKTVDSYYYHLLWNPPEIPLNTAYYEGKVIDNYIMNDDYLIYDFGGMSNHLRSMLINKPRTLENASTFVGSFPKSAALEPNLDDPKMFYCGMNWEKALGDNNRHAGLFELLDKTGKVKFYGPDVVESWGGIRPWEGYDCYQHPIPFDGFSILKEIHSCGICLVISSDVHRRAGAVTNRAYEACAAGAVIISDNNVFMEEYFGDSVLYVTYNKKNPKDTFEQIMEKYQWIVEHKEEALQMAKKAQKTFIDKFCMEKGLLDVTKNHYGRFKTIEKDLFAVNDEQTVLVTKVLNTQKKDKIEEEIERTIQNIRNQYYRNIVLGIACDETIKKDVEEYAKKVPVSIFVVNMQLFDEKGSRMLTDGQAIRKIQEQVPHAYFVNTYENEKWFYDHITTLIRTIEDDQEAVAAYAGLLSEDDERMRRTYMFDRLTLARVYQQTHPHNMPVSGQFLFKTEAEDYLPDYMLGCLDGKEYVAYVALLWIRYGKKIAFSKRMTDVWCYKIKPGTATILNEDRQIRFIRGLVKYDLPSTGLGTEGLIEQQRGRKEFLLMMPLTQSLSVRFWRKLSSHMQNRFGIGKLVYIIFQRKLKKYNEIMEKLQEG